MTTFTSEEKRLIEYAKEKILENCKKRKAIGLYDIIYAFVLSKSGKTYDGACFESTLPQCNICAERHAIVNMVLAETEKANIKCIFIAGPVPRKSVKAIAPCGMCRYVINEFSTSKTTIICSEFVRTNKDWVMFSRIDKYKIKELYPHPYETINWD